MSEKKSQGQLFNDKAREELYKRIAEDKIKREQEEIKRNNTYYPDTPVKNWGDPSGKGGSKRRSTKRRRRRSAKRRRRTMRR